jgi:hypothetical protein
MVGECDGVASRVMDEQMMVERVMDERVIDERRGRP